MTAPLRIGDMRVVHATSIVVPEGAKVYFDFQVNPLFPRLPVTILFRPPQEGEEGSDLWINKSMENGKLNLEFVGWNDHPTGAATTKPYHLGEVKFIPDIPGGPSLSAIPNPQVEVFLICACWTIGKVVKADLHFLVEDDHDR